MATKKTHRTEDHPDILDLCAEDVMQRKVVTIRADETLPDAERLLIEAQISGAPVIDEVGNVIGVVSLRDLTRHRTEDGEIPSGVDSSVFDDAIDETESVAFDRPSDGACVADVMTSELVTVVPTAALPQVAARMVQSQVHRVLVRDRGKLVGLISTMDLLEVLARA